MCVGVLEDFVMMMGLFILCGYCDKVLLYFCFVVEEGVMVVIGGGVLSFGDVWDDGVFVMLMIWMGLLDFV